MREEGAGDVADAFGVEEIELHEAFDRALAGAVGEFHPARDLALEIEGQPVLGAPREDVEMAAHREQEIFGALELAQLARRHQPGVDELGHGAYAVDELADPEERVKVAAPPLPLLTIGFDDVARIAHPFVDRKSVV